MTEKFDADEDLETLVETVEMAHGYRMHQAMHALQNEQTLLAVRHQGNADALLMVLRMIDKVRDGGDIQRRDIPEYRDMSRLLRQVNQRAKKDQQESTGMIGGFR